MIAYKLARLRKDGSIGSLFIDKKSKLPLNKWIAAEFHPTKGYAERCGWHCTPEPLAPHLSLKDRVWLKVQISDYYEHPRPEHQGGIWLIAQQMKILEILDENSG